MKYKKFIYIAENRVPVCVYAKHKPSEKNVYTAGRGNGTFRLDEYVDGKWEMPCFPEITWGMLKTLSYVGEWKDKKE